MVHTRPVVAVLGSGQQAHEELSWRVGRLLAERGYDLLTGGGGGVMAAVARAFVGVPERVGLSLAICPGEVDLAGHHPRPGYPNPCVELPIHTHLPLSGEQGTSPESRNHLLVLSAGALLFLPGGAGTRSEALLAVRYGRPALLYGPPEAFAGFPQELERSHAFTRLSDFLFEAFGGPASSI
jgi:predicted Rossmann-fold nucleotide-binding protein